MTIPFGPQLIGQAEKTLNALLDRFLVGTGLTEAHWVTLRLAQAYDGRSHGGEDLAAHVADRTHLRVAADLVEDLTARGLLADDRPTAAGLAMLDDVQSRIAGATASIWEGLPPDDVAVATRVLNEVLLRGREVLAAGSVT